MQGLAQFVSLNVRERRSDRTAWQIVSNLVSQRWAKSQAIRHCCHSSSAPIYYVKHIN